MVLEELSRQEIFQIISSFLGAFFAFIFFVFGQCWLISNKRRKNRIYKLRILKEANVFQAIVSEINKEIINDYFKIKNPETIYIHKLQSYSYMKSFGEDLYKFPSIPVDGSSLRVRKEIANHNIQGINKILSEISFIYRDFAMQKKETYLEETFKKIHNQTKKRMETLKSQVEGIDKERDAFINEIEFAIWYEKAPFWKKWHFHLRSKMNKAHKKKFMDKRERRSDRKD